MMKLLEFSDGLGESLSKYIGAPGNQLSLIITMLSVIPFCFLNYLIHGKNPRLIYSLVLGIFFQFSNYKFNCLHILFSGILTYLFINFYGRKLTAYYVFIFSFIFIIFTYKKNFF